MAASGAEFFTMNEVNRLKMIQDVIDRRLTTRLAAERLGISDRHCRRLLQRYREDGPLGMADRRRGKPSNYQLPEGLAEHAIQIIRERYADFGPTLACEKLAELHGVVLSKETVRKLMILSGLWIPRRLRAPKIQQPRCRRACVGELIQIDGCDHRWFENRGPACTLLVYVDDATSRLMQLHFVKSESTFTYFEATRGYLEQHGKPLAFYSDKASIFRINNKNAAGGKGQTQFGRAMNELNITGICANTSSAKGRVERAHLTLQDRLVKELRLRGISTPDAANAFADEFMADYNLRFAKAPRHDFDVHRPLDADDDLEAIFTWREPRKVSKSLTVRYDKMLCLLEDNEQSRRVIGKYLDSWQYPDGHVELRSNGTVLPYSAYDRLSEVDQGAIIDNKRLGHALAVAKLMQDKRDNTRSQALPAGTGPGRRVGKKDPNKKRQRAINEDDLLEAVNDLQTRGKEIFGG
ncbi:ISNCY family transposase [Pantoea phytobeneficialis]|uniref:ISNCY family transposase n=1 Tax=Pantoea phytobeneficialis TaxID=2052056 RepID=A0AAP9KRJ3_9GAMM|nr:ISNCY family transposase [Pantoea phytobeneficialis]MDO6407126.1 ISNCY family transposase [Pantoea phytobeneficialis]QGR09100.1 ISNCY family transposase [Pantoea phytobeneficialis]